MALNPQIILSGIGPDPVAAMARGNELASQQNAIGQQNALANVYRTQGAGIASGNQNALNALAALDPTAAQTARMNVQNIRANDQSYAMNEQSMAAAREKGRQDALARAAQADEATRAQEAENLSRALKGASFFYANGDKQGYDAFLTQNGIDPMQAPFEQFPAHAAMVEGAIEAYQSFTPEPPKPMSAEGKLQADFAAGLIDQQGLAAGLARLAPKGTETMIDPATGRVTIREGVSAGGDGVKPSDPQAMIDSIDGILNDPALPYATGWLAWTQNIPGTDARRFGARANQLQGQAFLQAFDSLKGAGQITEIEGQKATQAIGRLDTAQRAEDYAAALKELRALLEAGKNRPAGWSQGQGNQLSDDDLIKLYGGQ